MGWRAAHFSVRQFFCGLFFAAGLASSLTAADVRLFVESGVPVSDYDVKMTQLRPDDWLLFGDGERIRIGTKLGSGSFTHIFEVLEMEPSDPTPQIPKAIRLSRSSRYNSFARAGYLDVLDQFLPTQSLLEQGGVPVVRAFPMQSAAHEFVIVERLEIRFTYQNFLDGTGAVKTLSPTERLRIAEDFVDFAERTFRFRTVGDQLPEQIGYVEGRGWLFFDFGANTSRAHYVTDATLFTPDAAMVFAGLYAVQDGRMFGGGDERLPLPRALSKRVFDAIRERRANEGFSYSACWQFLQSSARIFKFSQERIR